GGSFVPDIMGQTATILYSDSVAGTIRTFVKPLTLELAHANLRARSMIFCTCRCNRCSLTIDCPPDAPYAAAMDPHCGRYSTTCSPLQASVRIFAAPLRSLSNVKCRCQNDKQGE